MVLSEEADLDLQCLQKRKHLGSAVQGIVDGNIYIYSLCSLPRHDNSSNFLWNII